MAVDLTIKQGDTSPPFNQAILDQNGNRQDLTGATVNFVMRALTATTPVVNAAASVLDASSGMVQYTFTSAQTATPGLYSGVFTVVLPGGATYTYPNDGYLEISVQENIVSADGLELVSVADAKDYLNIPSSDRTRDAKVLRYIRACRPVIEAITGPIIPTLFEEWHDGGQVYILLRRRPSFGYGTNPLLIVQAISEYNGPIEWPLALIASPDEGQLYSAMLEPQFGRVVRRTAGGGVQAFPNMPQSVHVWYTSGQSTIPDNVYEATLELLRVNFQQTQQGRPRAGGAGFGGGDDSEPVRTPFGFFVPGRVRELLGTNRRHPSLA